MNEQELLFIDAATGLMAAELMLRKLSDKFATVTKSQPPATLLNQQYADLIQETYKKMISVTMKPCNNVSRSERMKQLSNFFMAP